MISLEEAISLWKEAARRAHQQAEEILVAMEGAQVETKVECPWTAWRVGPSKSSLVANYGANRKKAEEMVAYWNLTSAGASAPDVEFKVVRQHPSRELIVRDNGDVYCGCCGDQLV